jgi:hypothetical protein
MLTARAVERLQEIARQISEEPLLYDQSTTGLPCGLEGKFTCGTPGCIFGWAVSLYATAEEVPGGYLTPFDIYALGARLLDIPSKRTPERDAYIYRTLGPTRGLEPGEIQTADRLFYEEFWPQRFRAGLELVGTSQAARQAVERIQHFIATDGRE